MVLSVSVVIYKITTDTSFCESQKKGSPISRGVWWLIGRVDTYRPKGREFDSHSSHQIGTLGKSFASKLPVALRRETLTHRAVSGAPLSSSGIEVVL